MEEFEEILLKRANSVQKRKKEKPSSSVSRKRVDFVSEKLA